MIEKPKILSDEKLEVYGENIHSRSRHSELGAARRVAQAQNDYCYKEMLRQFRASLEKIAWGTPPFKGIGNIDITGLGELIKALQELEEG